MKRATVEMTTDSDMLKMVLLKHNGVPVLTYELVNYYELIVHLPSKWMLFYAPFKFKDKLVTVQQLEWL